MNPHSAFGPASRIGFVGLGVMGAGMARCLLAKGFPLHVFARRPEVADAFREAGAQVESTVAALGACELVFLCVSDGPAVEDVLFGNEGLAAALASGSVVVDTSTIAAAQARSIGERLASMGIAFVDAPVSGGQQGAQQGTLGCMAGGPEPVIDACRPVMAAFCKSVTRVGDVGAGQAVKACNQVAVAACLMGVAEAMALAMKEGVDPAVMRDVVLGGTGRSFSMEMHGPRVIQHNYQPGFRARLMRKDLRLALDAARENGAVLPATGLAERLLDELCEAGRADWDWSALAVRVQELSGLPVPAQPRA